MMVESQASHWAESSNSHLKTLLVPSKAPAYYL